MTELKRTSFVFYDGFWNAIKRLRTAEEKAELLDAICTYEFTGEIPEMSYVCEVAFEVIRKSLDTATLRYAASVENGKKGGRPKKIENLTEPNETQQNLGEPKLTQGNPLETQGNHNVNVNDNANVNDSVNNSTTKVVGTPTKRISLKDQLVNYVNELEYSEETKQALFDWIFQIGLNGKVSVKQLQDKLDSIRKVYSDESLIRESIKEAYRNNWFGFFPVKNKPTAPTATQTTTNYSNQPDTRYTKGCWGTQVF